MEYKVVNGIDLSKLEDICNYMYNDDYILVQVVNEDIRTLTAVFKKEKKNVWM